MGALHHDASLSPSELKVSVFRRQAARVWVCIGSQRCKQIHELCLMSQAASKWKINMSVKMAPATAEGCNLRGR